MDFNKKIALIAAGSLLSVGGLYAVSASANAAQTPTTPAITSPISSSDVADANEANDVADANEANDVEGANEANDAEGANEGAEVAGE